MLLKLTDTTAYSPLTSRNRIPLHYLVSEPRPGTSKPEPLPSLIGFSKNSRDALSLGSFIVLDLLSTVVEEANDCEYWSC